VHSLAKLLALYGAHDLRIELISPAGLRAPAAVVEFVRSRGVEVNERESLDEVIGLSDVIYWTRVQQERFAEEAQYLAIADRFVMTPALLAAARDDAILMHPLPRKHEMGTEADHSVLDADQRSVYFHQMQNGMYVRMALLAGVLGAAG
jgi:aspartate carbamoyltransferase catalytic subunit